MHSNDCTFFPYFTWFGQLSPRIGSLQAYFHLFNLHTDVNNNNAYGLNVRFNIIGGFLWRKIDRCHGTLPVYEMYNVLSARQVQWYFYRWVCHNWRQSRQTIPRVYNCDGQILLEKLSALIIAWDDPKAKTNYFWVKLSRTRKYSPFTLLYLVVWHYNHYNVTEGVTVCTRWPKYTVKIGGEIQKEMDYITGKIKSVSIK